MNAEKENVLAQNSGVVAEFFELDKPDIVPEARLDEDFGIDNIDAVDLLTDLKVQTVQDEFANFSAKRNTQ